MPPALRPERVTQNRVVARLSASPAAGGLGYANLVIRPCKSRKRCKS
jgi:hypothetical protein